MDKWNRDEHLWIRRASVLCQLKFKENTNEKKLFEYCNNLKDEVNVNIKSGIEKALFHSQIKLGFKILKWPVVAVSMPFFNLSALSHSPTEHL